MKKIFTSFYFLLLAVGIQVKDISLDNRKYAITELLTGQSLGQVTPGQASISLTVPVKDAMLVKLVPVND